MSKFLERYWMLWEDKLTREKFADRLGVSSGQSNAWLHGTSEPDCDALAILAKRASQLASGSDKSQESSNYLPINERFTDGSNR